VGTGPSTNCISSDLHSYRIVDVTDYHSTWTNRALSVEKVSDLPEVFGGLSHNACLVSVKGFVDASRLVLPVGHPKMGV